MKLTNYVRKQLLSGLNRQRIDHAIEGIGLTSPRLIAFIFTENLMHLAPFCLPNTGGRFEPLLVLNGVSDDSTQWLTNMYPDKRIVRLRTSLTGNSQSILPHAAVLNDLLAVIRQPFCIQDPDCFVTNSRFFDNLSVDENEFAAGPFVKRPTDHDHVLPDTFFLMLNSPLYHHVSRKFGISADVIPSLPRKAMRAAQELGYKPGQFTENFKNYFDTLQAYWIVAQAEGKRFRLLQGAGESVFHIGGTSYLHNSDYDLAHWDYWPLSVQYFNLRLLEQPVNARFRNVFPALSSTYLDGDALLRKYPIFRDGRRYREIETILKTCLNAQECSSVSL